MFTTARIWELANAYTWRNKLQLNIAKLPWQKKKLNDLLVTDHLVNIQNFEKADQQQILPAKYNSLFLS